MLGEAAVLVRRGFYSVMAQFKCPPRRLLNEGETVQTNVAPQLEIAGKKTQCYQELTLKVHKIKNVVVDKICTLVLIEAICFKAVKKCDTENLSKYIHV